MSTETERGRLEKRGRRCGRRVVRFFSVVCKADEWRFYEYRRSYTNTPCAAYDCAELVPLVVKDNLHVYRSQPLTPLIIHFSSQPSIVVRSLLEAFPHIFPYLNPHTQKYVLPGITVDSSLTLSKIEDSCCNITVTEEHSCGTENVDLNPRALPNSSLNDNPQPCVEDEQCEAYQISAPSGSSTDALYLSIDSCRTNSSPSQSPSINLSLPPIQDSNPIPIPDATPQSNPAIQHVTTVTPSTNSGVITDSDPNPRFFSVLDKAYSMLWSGQISELHDLINTSKESDTGPDAYRHVIRAEANLMHAVFQVDIKCVQSSLSWIEAALVSIRTVIDPVRNSRTRLLQYVIEAQSPDFNPNVSVKFSGTDANTWHEVGLLVLECKCYLMQGLLLFVQDKPLLAVMAFRSLIKLLGKINANALTCPNHNPNPSRGGRSPDAYPNTNPSLLNLLESLRFTVGCTHVCMSVVPSQLRNFVITYDCDLIKGIMLLSSVVCAAGPNSRMSMCVCVFFLLVVDKSPLGESKHDAKNLVEAIVEVHQAQMSDSPSTLALMTALCFKRRLLTQAHHTVSQALQLYSNCEPPVPLLYESGMIYLLQAEFSAALCCFQKMLRSLGQEPECTIARQLHSSVCIYTAALLGLNLNQNSSVEVLYLACKTRHSGSNSVLHKRAGLLYACIRSCAHQASTWATTAFLQFLTVELLFLHTWEGKDMPAITYARCLEVLNASDECNQLGEQLLALDENSHLPSGLVTCELDAAVYKLLLKGLVLSRTQKSTRQSHRLLTAVGNITTKMPAPLPISGPLVSYGLYVASLIVFKRSPSQESARMAAGTLAQAAAVHTDKFPCGKRIDQLRKDIKRQFPSAC